MLALKGGFRTSEFWLGVLALAVTATAAPAATYVAHLHNVASTSSGTAALVATLGAAIISGAYSIARAMTKTGALSAAATAAAPDPGATGSSVTSSAPAPDALVSAPPATAAVIATASGNTLTPGPGSPENEAAHRAAVEAATDALRVATAALARASNLPKPATFGSSASSPADLPSAGSSSAGNSPGAPAPAPSAASLANSATVGSVATGP